jgi:hypothetical protein
MILYGWLYGFLWPTAWFSMTDCMVFYGRQLGFLYLTALFSLADCKVFYGLLHTFFNRLAFFLWHGFMVFYGRMYGPKVAELPKLPEICANKEGVCSITVPWNGGRITPGD